MYPYVSHIMDVSRVFMYVLVSSSFYIIYSVSVNFILYRRVFMLLIPYQFYFVVSSFYIFKLFKFVVDFYVIFSVYVIYTLYRRVLF